MALAEEVDENVAQLHHCLLESWTFCRSVTMIGRYKLGVVQSQKHHYQAYYCHDNGPRHDRTLTLGNGCCGSIERTYVAREVLDEHTGEHHETTRGGNLGNIIECALPSDVARLVFI